MKLAIVGGGVFGTAAAWEGVKRGYKVDLYERDRVPSLLAASNDISKATRLEYGELTSRYAPLVERAFGLWRDAEKISGKSFFHNTGVITLAKNFVPGQFAYESWRELRALGHETEVLEQEEGRRRFPQFNWDKLQVGTYNSLGGWLNAEVATRALGECAEIGGACLYQHAQVQSVDDGSVTVNGDRRSYDAVLVTAGAWVSELVPSLATEVRVSRQRMAFYKPSQNFTAPVWLHDPETSGWYGFPTNAEGIVKVALHRRSETVHPDDSREIDQIFLDQSRHLVQELLPGLDPESLVGGRCCFYTNSPSGDLIIQSICSKLFVAGLGSGHGFKFGPVLGQLALDEIENGSGEFRIRAAAGNEAW